MTKPAAVAATILLEDHGTCTNVRRRVGQIAGGYGTYVYCRRPDESNHHKFSESGWQQGNAQGRKIELQKKTKDRHTDTQTHRHTDRHADTQTHKTHRHTASDTDRLTDTQTDRH